MTFRVLSVRLLLQVATYVCVFCVCLCEQCVCLFVAFMFVTFVFVAFVFVAFVCVCVRVVFHAVVGGHVRASVGCPVVVGEVKYEYQQCFPVPSLTSPFQCR